MAKKKNTYIAQRGDWSSFRDDIAKLFENHEKHERILFGNGRPGLVQMASKLEGSMNGVAEGVSQMRDSVRSMEASAIRLDAHVDSIGKSVDAVQIKIKKLEKMIIPIIDWKKGIIIRLTTIAATVATLVGAAWWVYEQWDKIKAVFK